MCVQSKVAASNRLEESLHRLHDFQNAARISAQRVYWAGFMSRISVLKHYADGRLSLVFDVPASRHRDIVGKVINRSKREATFLQHTHFIFSIDSASTAVLNHWG